MNDLQKNCLSVSPEEHNSVENIMVPFKGRNLLSKYMPDKQHNGDSKSGDAVESAEFYTTLTNIKVDQTITRLDLVSVVMMLTS